MTKEREALKLALDALELHLTHHEHGCVYLDPAVTAIKEALAQPEQEPVGEAHQMSELVEGFTHCIWDARVIPVGTKLYTTPPQRTWVGLTDKEAMQICEDCGCLSEDWLVLLDAIEAKLKEKNA